MDRAAVGDLEEPGAMIRVERTDERQLAVEPIQPCLARLASLFVFGMSLWAAVAAGLDRTKLMNPTRKAITS